MEHLASIGVDVIIPITSESAKRIVDKAMRAEKLSDWEVGFLLIEAMRMPLGIGLRLSRPVLGP